MEYNPNPSEGIPSSVEAHRKNATTSMVCGIISLVLVWWGLSTIAALILAIIAFVKVKNNRAFAQSMGILENGQNKAGYICGLIGIILSAVILFFLILVIGLAIAFGATLLREQLPYLPEFFEGMQMTFSGLPLLFISL